MRWELEWGEFLDDLRKRAADGLPTPVLDREPVLEPYDRFVWTAFNELSARRQFGFAANPISLSDMAVWFEMQGIRSVPHRQDLARLIAHMDTVWLDFQNEKAKADQKK